MSPPRDHSPGASQEDQRFEALLIDLSTRFVNVPADQVDREIEDAQRRVCECLQLDASSLWQWTGQPSAQVKLTHMHRPLGGPPPPTQAEVQVAFPWTYARTMAGRMYANSTLDDLPPEAERDKATLQRHGVKSNIGLPLSVGGRPPVGVLTFNTTRKHRVWTESIVARLQLVAQIFANALARKYADAQSRLHLRQLAHLNRVATMVELSTALAHELNQPLGAILRNAEAAEIVLHEAAPDLQELRAIVADIKRDDERAGGVIDRLRTLLRQRSIELQRVDLARLVDEVVSLAFADATARGIRIVSTVPEDLPAVHCDRVHVQQVLLNLMMNGMDAICEAPGDDPRVTVRAQVTGNGQVEVCVSDTGAGVTAEAHASVFDPFFTTKVGGMGMGLAISRTIIEAHGGRIWVEADGGRGASIHFTLPVHAAQSSQ